MRKLITLLFGLTSAYSCDYDYCTPTYLYSPFTDTPSSSVTGTASSSITSSASASSTSMLIRSENQTISNSTIVAYIPILIFGSGIVLFILIFVIIYCSIRKKIIIKLNSS
jgi:hypothetical protein